MKKFIVLILFIVYGSASFGISLNYFYCCNKLKEISFSLNTEGTHRCDMKMVNKSCCDNKSVIFKVSPDQKANFQTDYNFQAPTLLAVLPVGYHCQSLFNALKAHPQFNNLPPPLLTDRTVLYANFRI